MVLAGGISHERDVSLKSGRRVADALIEAGAEIVIREPDGQLLHNIASDRPDVIWPVLHGSSGEDGALRDILALTGVPFVGADAAASRLAWDKSVAKVLVAREGIQTPQSVTLPKETFRELDADSVLSAVVSHLALPVVVKPVRSGSAQGLTRVFESDQLSRAMVDAYAYCDVALIEKLVQGTELAISVVDLGAGPFALPAVEIEPLGGVFGYEERYTPGQTTYYTPARISSTVAEQCSKVAISVHKILGLRHLSRIDLIVDQHGTPWFLEANVLPGLTETSLLPQAVEASGVSLGETYYSIAQAALSGRG